MDTFLESVLFLRKAPEYSPVWQELNFFCTQKSIFFIGKGRKVYFLSTSIGWISSCVSCRLVIALVYTKTRRTNLSQILSRELMKITELYSLFASWTKNKHWPPLFWSRRVSPLCRELHAILDMRYRPGYCLLQNGKYIFRFGLHTFHPEGSSCLLIWLFFFFLPCFPQYHRYSCYPNSSCEKEPLGSPLSPTWKHVK